MQFKIGCISDNFIDEAFVASANLHNTNVLNNNTNISMYISADWLTHIQSTTCGKG